MSPTRRRGLSIIQVLVASAVLVVAFLPLIGLFGSAVRTGAVSRDELRAAVLADEFLTQLRVLAHGPGLGVLPDYPLENPPPHQGWVDTGDPGGEYYQRGAPLWHPGDPARPAGEVDPESWRRVGASAASPGSPPLARSLARLYLSPLPPGFSRRFRVYAPPLGPGPDAAVDPDLRRVEVEIAWTRDFAGGASRARKLRVGSLVSHPGGGR